MSDNKILVPVDFSAASDKAVEYGTMVAGKINGSITLLHVFEDDSLSLDACNSELDRLARQTAESSGISCDYICENGDIFKVIPAVAARPEYKLAVIATHGRKGIKQKLFGANIIKLLKKISKPVIVVQENTAVSKEVITRAVFAVGGHDAYERKVNGMTMLAGIFDPEVLLYSISRPGDVQSEKLKENIRLAEKLFSENNVRYKRIKEEQKVFSVGFAKQTLDYASKTGADLIAIMVNPTREHHYFADSDKEAILTNDKGIAVLSISDAEENL